MAQGHHAYDKGGESETDALKAKAILYKETHRIGGRLAHFSCGMRNSWADVAVAG